METDGIKVGVVGYIGQCFFFGLLAPRISFFRGPNRELNRDATSVVVVVVVVFTRMAKNDDQLSGRVIKLPL